MLKAEREMTQRTFAKITPEGQVLRIKLLTSENLKLHKLIAKLEVANISLQNENRALKKNIEAKATEKFSEMVGQILQRSKKVAATPRSDGSIDDF